MPVEVQVGQVWRDSATKKFNLKIISPAERVYCVDDPDDPDDSDPSKLTEPIICKGDDPAPEGDSHKFMMRRFKVRYIPVKKGSQDFYIRESVILSDYFIIRLADP
jgi:hypothetical protein